MPSVPTKEVALRSVRPAIAFAVVLKNIRAESANATAHLHLPGLVDKLEALIPELLSDAYDAGHAAGIAETMRRISSDAERGEG